MKDNPLIFGISDGEYDGPYTFVDVLGVVTEGRIEVVPNPKRTFPDRGTVFLSADFWIPPEGQGAVWRVAPHPSTEHTAKYNVVSRGRSGPKEIISIPHASSEPDRVRACLFEGIALGYVSGNEVLVELRDRVVIGPIRADFNRLPDLRGFFCSEDSFRDPLGRWEHVSALEPIEVTNKGTRRRFTSFMDLPEAPGSCDLADFETKLEIVLRFAARTGALEDLTRAKIDALTDLLRNSDVPQRVATRAEEVLATASEAVLTKERVAQLVESVVATPGIKAAIEREKVAAREEEMKRLESEQTELNSELKSLKAERRRLRDEVQQWRREAERSAEAVGGAVQEKFDKLQDDASDLLATIAVLKPFLGAQRTAAGPSLGADPLRTPRTVDLATDLEELQATLKSNIESIGVQPPYSKVLSAEVLAAVLAGQPAIFSGSVAPLIARACAYALAAGSAYRIRIPVGVLDGQDLQETLSVVGDEVDETETVSVAVLEGMNRSAFEAYGDSLRESWIESALGRAPANGRLYLGTVVTGVSALPVSEALTELGPIFNTDALPLGEPDAESEEHGRIISVSDWTQWSETISEVPFRQRLELYRLLEGVARRTPSWERVLNRALRGLSGLLPEQGGESPLASLCFGWVVPHALSLGAEADGLLDAVRAEIAEVEAVDPRLMRLLEWVSPAEAER